ncbi:MAG: methyltransferase domain-containing protein [Anaerolineae bacterium]
MRSLEQMFHVEQGAYSVADQHRNGPRIIDYEDSTYRTDFWQGQGREYEDAVERIAIGKMLPSRGRRVVDIGAGFGRLAGLYGAFDEVVLVDYSRSQLEFARQQLGDERFVYVAADLYRLPLASGAADAAVMVRVMHHLLDVPAAVAQLARMITAQGTLVLEFANKRHLKNIFRYLLHRGLNPFDREPAEFADLHLDFHPAWVRQRLTEAGFHVEQQRAVSMFRLGILKRTVPVAWLAGLDGLLQRPLAPLTPGPSVFLKSRRQGAAAGVPVDRSALFCCPDCGHEPLVPANEGVRCPACGSSWPIVNGVYTFKPQD